MKDISAYGIKFVNKRTGTRIFKSVEYSEKDKEIHWIMAHISSIYEIDLLTEYIDIAQKALEDRFDEVDDPEVSSPGGIAFVTSKMVEFWEDDGKEILFTCSLETFLHFLSSWKEFLEAPPYHNHSIFNLKAWIRRF